MSGTVVDAEGRPVEGVEVNLLVETDRSQKRETLTTDARGVYRDAHPIVQGTRYRAIVQPGRYAIATSETMTAGGAESLTLPPVAVVRMRTIAGRVVDTSGRPVVGARVLNWGNPAPLSDAVTGPTGRFQLESFPRERAFLFVDGPGFRFPSTATPDPGKSTTELTIRRDSHPPERGVASLGPPITRERALELAGKVLKPYTERIIKPRWPGSRGQEPGPRGGGRDRPGRARRRKCQAGGGAPWDSNPVRGSRPSAISPPSAPRTPRPSSPRSRTTSRPASLRIELIDALPPAARDRKLALLDEALLEGEPGRPTSVIGSTT